MMMKNASLVWVGAVKKSNESGEGESCNIPWMMGIGMVVDSSTVEVDDTVAKALHGQQFSLHH